MNRSNDDKAPYDYLAKVLIIGDSTVGKTCLLTRFCEGSMSKTHIATIGIDFMIKTIDVEGKRIKLQMMDTAGQEKYRSIVEGFYRGAVGIILLYSVDDEKTFENIGIWMKQIKSHVIESACIILIGNKCDMSEREIDKNEGEKMAQRYGLSFYETSAREGTNVEEAFLDIAKQIKTKFEKGVFKKLELSTKEAMAEAQKYQKLGGKVNEKKEPKSGCTC